MQVGIGIINGSVFTCENGRHFLVQNAPLTTQVRLIIYILLL